MICDCKRKLPIPRHSTLVTFDGSIEILGGITGVDLPFRLQFIPLAFQ
jgi:hypothetical protein